jgi:hypothetical protein
LNAQARLPEILIIVRWRLHCHVSSRRSANSGTAAGLEVFMEPSVFVLLFPVFYVILAVDLVALCAAVAFLKMDRRAAREHEWRVVAVEEEQRAA